MDPVETLAAYADLLRAAAPRLDLVAPGDLERLEERHLADSLKALPLLGSLPPGEAIDVGSGAGLPGIPLAIHTPERHWRLLEPRRKRAAFLEDCVRHLELSCEVVVMRAEEAARDPGLARAHILATARALAPPRDAFPLLTPLVRPGGIALVWVGPSTPVPPEAEVRPDGLATLPIGPD